MKQVKSNMLAFDAIVQSVKTLADGGLRVSFDLPESATEAAKTLMDYKRDEVALRVAVGVQDGT